MDTLRTHVSMVIDKSLYTKDPMTSVIGQDIIRHAVEQIAANGLDQFTFRKLATSLKSTESTLYRYFQNKHQLATYLASYHWSLMEWRIAFATANIADHQTQFENALRELCLWVRDDQKKQILNEAKLQRFVLTAGFTTFLPLDLNKSDRISYTKAYSDLIHRIATIVRKSHPHIKSPEAFSTTIVESIHHQMYLQLHAPHLTDIASKAQQLFLFAQQIFTSQSYKK
jgi:AcrR family transcriptional regulator